MTENTNTTPAEAAVPGWVVVATASGRAVAVRGVTVHATETEAEAAAVALADEMADWFGTALALKVLAAADYVAPNGDAVTPTFAPAPADLAALAANYPAPATRTTYEFGVARGGWLYRNADTEARGRNYTGYASADDAAEEAAELVENLAEREIDGYRLTIVRRATTTTVSAWEIA